MWRERYGKTAGQGFHQYMCRHQYAISSVSWYPVWRTLQYLLKIGDYLSIHKFITHDLVCLNSLVLWVILFAKVINLPFRYTTTRKGLRILHDWSSKTITCSCVTGRATGRPHPH
jgi:hypothetical protein